MKQVVLSYLPGYMFDGYRLVSTGIALKPTQFINRETGEVMVYVRPLFEFGPTVGMFIRYQGILDYVQKLEQDESGA